MRHLLPPDEVGALIERGETLLLAGEEALLRTLPPGRWVAGTIPYFMTEVGGVSDRSRLFVQRPGPGLELAGVRRYTDRDIHRVYVDLPDDGVGIMIAPALSHVHLGFALDAPSYERFARAPLFGWIAGVHLQELARARAMVFDGTEPAALGDAAVVLHARLRPGWSADLAIVNPFVPGDGPVVTFPETGFTATLADVDGRRVDLAEHVRATNLDTRLPLVADYSGAPINVSFQAVDHDRHEVRFFAPVFAGVEYRHARPVGDYVRAFESVLPPSLARDATLSCNCVLNYVHSSLEGRTTGGVTGPITFGEIAYQLLNQTMVVLTVSAGRPAAPRPPR